MKTLRTLKIGPNAPDTNSLWLYKNKARYFNNGKWEELTGNTLELEEKVDSLDKEVGGLEKHVNNLESEVKKLQGITGIDNLATGADLATVVTTVNDILDALKVAGIITV